MITTESPYLFRASSCGFEEVFPESRTKLAKMMDGISVLYQERFPSRDGYVTPWCEVGHTIAIVSGKLKLDFENHSVVLGPGDMAHIPAGPKHRHRGSVYGDDVVKYFLTLFTYDGPFD